jgi:hypothetical protein
MLPQKPNITSHSPSICILSLLCIYSMLAFSLPFIYSSSLPGRAHWRSALYLAGALFPPTRGGVEPVRSCTYAARPDKTTHRSSINSCTVRRAHNSSNGAVAPMSSYSRLPNAEVQQSHSHLTRWRFWVVNGETAGDRRFSRERRWWVPPASHSFFTLRETNSSRLPFTRI